MVAQSQMINDRLISSDVATCSAKRFCKCAHHNIHVSWIDAIKVANATTVLAQCTNGVSFVDVKIKLFVYAKHEKKKCVYSICICYLHQTPFWAPQVQANWPWCLPLNKDLQQWPWSFSRDDGYEVDLEKWLHEAIHEDHPYCYAWRHGPMHRKDVHHKRSMHG